jgi:hypothetical protein
MRLFIYLMLLLLLTASAAGCGSKAPADSNPPPGVIKNPIRPNPEIIRKRKLMLIDPQMGGNPPRFENKR